MQRWLSKVSMAAPIVAASMFFAAVGAFAQDAQVVRGGRTSVTLSHGFVTALGDLHVTPGVVNPSGVANGKVYFTISGGVVDLDTAKLQILHTGGLTLSAGSTKVWLTSFIIDTTGSAPVITGLVTVDGKLLGRVRLFDLQLPSGITLPLKAMDSELALKNVGVWLDAAAAADLNAVFKVSAFKGGFEVGTANVYAFVQ